MSDDLIAYLSIILEILLQLTFMIRVIMRPHREPTSRIAWLVVIAALPVFGMIIYILLGETNLGRKRVKRRKEIEKRLPAIKDFSDVGTADTPERYKHLFQTGKTVNGFEPVEGNRGRLMDDSNATITSMVADMDAAGDHIHLEFYIWLPDNNGLKVVEALKRAASRDVACRVMADSLGSRSLIKSRYWKSMKNAGVEVVNTLPIGIPIYRALHGRIDLRNHRKIVVIDNRITYCGSQNCADP
ncbi:MAG: PLDc N-terminal domain-containing protein, partial [Spirochaetaceae bacterium]|nr:PLDc N-terminal domain-containing protein [Spirochaetaceae bacterium]